MVENEPENANEESATVVVVDNSTLPSEPDNVTVVVNADDSADDAVTSVDLDHERRITNLENAVTDVADIAVDAAIAADTAQATADFAADAATDVAGDTAALEEVTAEVVADDLAEAGEDVNGDGETDEEDEPPMTARKHWFFASFRDLRDRRKK